MTSRHPSRLALAVFDYFISDNDPLRGDLTEEFLVRQSQAWLWWQVIGAVAVRPGIVRGFIGEIPFRVLAIAILVLMAFEVVFFTNVIHQSLFGPPVQDIRGFAYLAPLWFNSVPPSSAKPPLTWAWLPLAVAVTSSLPIGWWIAQVREHHRVLASTAFSLAVTICAVANLQNSLLAQFVTSLVFSIGLLSAGPLHAMVDTHAST